MYEPKYPSYRTKVQSMALRMGSELANALTVAAAEAMKSREGYVRDLLAEKLGVTAGIHSQTKWGAVRNWYQDQDQDQTEAAAWRKRKAKGKAAKAKRRKPAARKKAARSQQSRAGKKSAAARRRKAKATAGRRSARK